MHFMTQRLLHPISILLSIGDCCGADAIAKPRSIASPNKAHSVVFSNERTFTIQDANGAVALSSADIPKIRDLAEIRREHVLWSPDSRMVAIAGGGGHDLATFVFVLRDKAFVHVPVPSVTGDRDNPYVTPLKWLNDQTLTLNISGPHAGKADAYHYKGTTTIRISGSPPVSKVLGRKISDH
jgi:hypothetical protein